MFAAAEDAIKGGANILILSDRGVSPELAPIPAVARDGGGCIIISSAPARGDAPGLVLESGEPREVHHFALLIGYGCSAINPYLAYETIDDLIAEGLLQNTDHKKAVKKFVKAAIKGVVKTMAKMGISTVQSYRGAQIFEAVGLNSEVVDKYFTWTPVAHRRRRPQGHRRGGAGAPSPRVPARIRQCRARSRRPVSMARQR